MFGNKKEKEEIAKLRHEIAELKEIVKTQELIKLRAENARLKELEQQLLKVHIQLKSVAYLMQDDCVLVKYKIPDQQVYIKDGKVQMNETFYAINKLRLLSLDDMKKIQVVIDDVKKKGE